MDAWLYPADVLAALMRPLTHDPIVIAGQRNVDPQGYFGPLERPVRGVVRRLTNVVVANSDAARRHAISAGSDPAKVRVIRNGVAIRPLASAADVAAARARLGIPDPHTIVVGCVANFSPVKRHDLLLRAIAPLAAEGYPIRLVLIGDGGLRSAIQDEVQRLGLSGHVLLQGSVADPEPLYAGIDVVVQASEREGLPNALLEASAAARPIVATAAGGTDEIVVDGRTGFLVPIGGVAGLTMGLRRLIGDPALRAELGAGARQQAVSTFGMDRFVDEFAGLYEGLAARRQAARRTRRTPS